MFIVAPKLAHHRTYCNTCYFISCLQLRSAYDSFGLIGFRSLALYPASPSSALMQSQQNQNQTMIAAVVMMFPENVSSNVLTLLMSSGNRNSTELVFTGMDIYGYRASSKFELL